MDLKPIKIFKHSQSSTILFSSLFLIFIEALFYNLTYGRLNFSYTFMNVLKLTFIIKQKKIVSINKSQFITKEDLQRI